MGLFAVGIVIADWRAAYPGLSHTGDELATYFTQNRGAVRGLAVFHTFAALALLVFTAHTAGRLRAAAVAGTVPAIALAGGAAAAVMLLFDAMLFWTLSLPSVPAEPGLIRVLHTLSYLAGGTALTPPLGAFIGSVSVVASRTGLLPRWLVWWGAVATVESLLYGATLVAWEGPFSPSGVLVLAIVLPIGWVLAASISLLRHPAPG